MSLGGVAKTGAKRGGQGIALLVLLFLAFVIWVSPFDPALTARILFGAIWRAISIRTRM